MTRPRPTTSETVLKIGERSRVSWVLREIRTEPSSATFFLYVKVIPPVANPMMPRTMRTIPMIVTGFKGRYLSRQVDGMPAADDLDAPTGGFLQQLACKPERE